MWKQDLALNNEKWLICHKSEAKNTQSNNDSTFDIELVAVLNKA